MAQNDWILGIDFGTSNTSAAHTNAVKGVVEAVNLGHNTVTMPSSVYLGEGDKVAVGNVAIDRGAADPTRFIPAPKRLVPQQTFQINGYDVESSLPVSAVLSSVVERATREHNGVAPSGLVLTYPETWSRSELGVLLSAATDLGVARENILTVSEPQAAAYYYSKAEPLSAGERIAVFDFGGGTLDVAVLEANQDGSFSVIAAQGEPTLGGKSFDAAIRRWVDHQLEEDDPELLDYLRNAAPIGELHALEDSIRRAKELLSESSAATISFAAAGEIHKLQLTREELEEVIAPLVDNAVRVTRKTLTDAGVSSPDALRALYLTGGSSRIPLVQEALKDLGPLATLDDPKTVVAQGALGAVAPVISNLSAGGAGQVAGQPPSSGQTTTFPAAGQPGGQPAGQSADPAAAGAHGGAPATAAGGGRKGPGTGLIIGGVTAAVLVVALIVGVVMFLNRSPEPEPTADPDPTDTAAPGDSTGATGASGSSSTPATSATSEGDDPVEAALAAVPESLKPIIGDCFKDHSNTVGDGADGIRCEIPPGQEAEKYFSFQQDWLTPELKFYVDAGAQEKERARIRGGSSFPDPVFTKFEVDSDVAAWVVESYTRGEGEILVADRSKNLVITGDKFNSTDAAEQFLNDFNLL
ncbi:Hsp70 family protein [Corynebacterium frankenforstense]